MASDLSSGCTETIDILDDEKEEGEISLEDVSSSEEGGMGHLTCSYVFRRTIPCTGCKSWSECTTWCNVAYHPKTRRDPVKGKENRHHVREAGYTVAKHTISTLQEKNDDLVPISSDSDMEIVGLTDTSNRSKAKVKKKKRKKKDYELLSIDELISPSSIELPVKDVGALKIYKEVSSVHRSSGKSKVISRSPARKYRSQVGPQTSRSPVNHSRSPIQKRSVRKVRSPKRSPRRHSPVRTAKRPPPKPSLPSSTRSHVDRHGDVTRLLKKVKHLDSIGTHTSEPSVNRNKESSLKDKLSNMLKRVSSDDHAMHLKKKTRAQPETMNDADDEDDEALLRQKALETKQKKSHRSLDHLADAESEKRSSLSNDDQDEEALQLRMIALRSAVMKKHQNRVQRGIKAKRSTRSESPFNSNFLDDIPVPGEELLRYPSPPCTPSCESNHIEDMDLDTDIEREKEKLPYSPTDKITENIPIDTALLGIEPSDVSFINVNETATSPVFEDAQDEFVINNLASFYNKTYLPCQVPATQYFPPSQYGNETYHSNFNDTTVNKAENSHDGIVCDVINGICCQEGTYSSTGVLSDTSQVPMSKNFFTPPISPHGTLVTSPQMQQIVEQPINDGTAFANVDSALRNDNLPYEMQSVSGYSVIPDAAITTAYTQGYDESRSPNESIITIDELPENDTDPSAPNIVLSSDKSIPNTEHIPKETSSCPAVVEPLYMQGVPDITKDRNKIPTLINRRLVPVPILKSNKLLQQHPKKKKKTPQSGPAFKSAEMQPVTITLTDASSNVFKPIKLQVAKKSVLSMPTTFHHLVNEPLNVSNNEKPSPEKAIESEHFDILSTSNEATSTRGKKRKRIKKNNRQSVDSVPLSETANNSNSEDINIANAPVDRQSITVSSKNDDNDTQDNLIENNSVKLLSISDTEKTVNFNEILVEKNDTEKNNNAVLSTSIESSDKRRGLQEEHTKEPNCLSTDSMSGNSNLFIIDKAVESSVTKCDSNRRQSIDEDEDELRAILLASLKRTKLAEISSSVASDSVKKSAVTVPPSALKTTGSMPSTINITNNHVLLPSIPSTSSETQSKKINDVSASVPNGSKKKIGTLDATKNLPKKVTRKSLTSAKVVNNAKKYQNMIVQRKLNLRKLDKNTAITKPSENTWLSAGVSKTSHSFDTQRFVISLGESDTDSESEGETNKSIPEKHQTHQEISADFEKNLNKFLRDVRTEQEQSAAASKSSTQAAKQDEPQMNKNSSNMPLAVRHLPASQQEEYRRLKQVILEREKLKLQRKIANNNSSSGGSSSTNNKLLSVNVTKISEQSMPLCDKKTQMKENQNKLKMSEKNLQEEAIEIERKSDDLTKGTPESYVCRTPAEKIISSNITKNANVTGLQVKNGKKAIPNDLSIRISNVTTSSPNEVVRTIENLHDKQPTKDKQQHKPALKVLTLGEINKKYVQVMLKPNTTERVVTINDKSVLQHDEPVVNHNQSLVKSDVSIEIINDKIVSNVDNNAVNISTASTVELHPSVESNVAQHEDSLDTTCPLSDYQAEEHQRKINRNISTSVLTENNDSTNTSQTKSGVVVNNDSSNTNNIWNELKKSVKAKLDSLKSLPKDEQERYLRETENKLVAKRYMLLDHLAEMSGNLRQWDMEEDVQITLAIEVRKLKEQLKIAEEKLQHQRDRVNSMSPKVSVARRKINAGRQECFKLTKICSNLGNRLLGKTYKLPEAVAQLLDSKFKEVANYTRQFAKKKNYSSDTSENSYSSLFQETSELSKDMCTEENLSLQEKSSNNAINIDEAGLKSDTSRSMQSNKNKTTSTIISETSSHFSQMILRQVTPEKEETSINALNHCNEEQISANQSSASSSKPKLYQNNCVEQNNKHLEENRRKTNESDPPIVSKPKLLTIDSSNQECNKQSNKKILPQMPSSSSSSLPSPSSLGSAPALASTSRVTVTTDTTMTDTTATNITTTDTTTNTTSTATKTIKPYKSILTHLKEPKNINPYGILCPYEMMGICRDECCQYIHLSRN